MTTQFNVEFSEDGLRARIVFPNGAKSAWYFSKSGILRGLQALFQSPPPKVKVHITDVLALTWEIEEKDELPNDEANMYREIVLLPGSFFFDDFDMLGDFLGQSDILAAEVKTYFVRVQPDSHLSVGRCYCGGGHYRFRLGNEFSSIFYSREGGIEVLSRMQGEQKVNGAQVKKLLTSLTRLTEIPAAEDEVLIRD